MRTSEESGRLQAAQTNLVHGNLDRKSKLEIADRWRFSISYLEMQLCSVLSLKSLAIFWRPLQRTFRGIWLPLLNRKSLLN